MQARTPSRAVQNTAVGLKNAIRPPRSGSKGLERRGSKEKGKDDDGEPIWPTAAHGPPSRTARSLQLLRYGERCEKRSREKKISFSCEKVVLIKTICLFIPRKLYRPPPPPPVVHRGPRGSATDCPSSRHREGRVGLVGMGSEQCVFRGPALATAPLQGPGLSVLSAWK